MDKNNRKQVVMCIGLKKLDLKKTRNDTMRNLVILASSVKEHM